MTDQTRETLAKLLDRENIEAARYWGHGDTRQQHHELNAAALRDVLTLRTCGTCRYRGAVAPTIVSVGFNRCENTASIASGAIVSADDGCIKGWQAREGEGYGDEADKHAHEVRCEQVAEADQRPARCVRVAAGGRDAYRVP